MRRVPEDERLCAWQGALGGPGVPSETASRTGCVQASVLLGVDSVRIGVLLGAVARVAYRWVARGGWSMHADGASARIFH